MKTQTENAVDVRSDGNGFHIKIDHLKEREREREKMAPLDIFSYWDAAVSNHDNSKWTGEAESPSRRRCNLPTTAPRGQKLEIKDGRRLEITINTAAATSPM